MKKRKEKGITLIALVISIIILLILAGISIQALTNQGLFVQANRAKKETQRAQVTEWLDLKLMEEKMHNPNGTAEEIIEATRAASYGNIELKKMGKSVVVDENTSTQEDGEQVDVYFYVQVDEDVYKVEMAGAKFIGEAGKFPPVIKLESIISTTNSITVKIKVSRNEEGTLEIYKKEENDTEYLREKIATGEESKGLEYTFSGLEQNKIYSIKIVATAQNGQVKECIKEITTAKQLVNEIKITPESATIQIGETLDLSVTISPEDAYNKAIIWNSSNPEVATIEQNGKLTAIVEGTTTISAIAQDGSGKTASCDVTVEKSVVWLYNEGDECTSITGGWTTLTSQNLTKASNYMQYRRVFVGWVSDNHISSIRTSKKIQITKKNSSINAICAWVGQNEDVVTATAISPYLTMSDDWSTYESVADAKRSECLKDLTLNTKYQLKIELNNNFEGDYYIGFQYGWIGPITKIYKVWLE